MARQRANHLIADVRDLVERPGGVLGVVLLLGGALVLLLGLVAAILVGPDSTWTAARTLPAGSTGVVVTSGVVGAVGPEVSVSVRRADGGPLYLARAVSGDVTDLTRGSAVLQVTGVRPLHRLTTRPAGAGGSLGRVETSDVWRDVSTGSGTRSLDWRPGQGAQSVLVVAPDGTALPALRLQVSWHRGGWFPAALLVMAIGLVMLVEGLHLLSGHHLMHRLVNRLLRMLSSIPMPARRPLTTGEGGQSHGDTGAHGDLGAHGDVGSRGGTS